MFNFTLLIEVRLPSRSPTSSGRLGLRWALEQSDQVPFRVTELTQLDSGLHLRRPDEASTAELLGLRKRRLDIGNLDVERQVSGHARRDCADTAADPDAFEIGLVLDEAVA